MTGTLKKGLSKLGLDLRSAVKYDLEGYFACGID